MSMITFEKTLERVIYNYDARKPGEGRKHEIPKHRKVCKARVI